jgi:hypothetical protein
MARNCYDFGEWIYGAEEHSRLDGLLLELKEEFPDLVICPKNRVWYHRVLHVLVCIVTLFINRRYLDGFTTLMSGNLGEQDRLWVDLSHERVHLRQFRDYGFFKMVLMYLFPPFLLAYGRYKIELPAYLETLKCQYKLNKEYTTSKEYREWWINQFTGPNYGWMMVLRSKVEAEFRRTLNNLETWLDKSELGSFSKN